MRSIGPKIWIEERPLKLPVVGNIGMKMITIQLQNGELMLISPVPLNESLKQELKDLGPVKYLVGPNSLHHLSLRPYHEAYPEAALAGPMKLQKRKKLKFDITLVEGQVYDWSAEVDMLLVDTKGMMCEAVFFHKPSKTLIVTDFLHNLPKPNDLSGKIVYYLNGFYRGLTTSNLARMAWNDRKYLKERTAKMSQWDFDQIVMAHGEIIPKDGKQKFLQSIQWLQQ